MSEVRVTKLQFLECGPWKLIDDAGVWRLSLEQQGTFSFPKESLRDLASILEKVEE